MKNTWKDESTVTTDIEENRAHVICEGTQIRTKEQFLEACEMKTEITKGEWKLADKIRINTWNAQLKGGFPIQMFQVKADFVRKVPKPVLPVLRPVSINLSETVEPRPCIKNEGLLLHLTDTHFGYNRNMDTGKLVPYHDRDAMSIALQLAKMVDFDVVVWGGDIMDLAEWSTHYASSPEYYWTTKTALLEAAWWIGQIVKARPNAKHVALAGNHDDRLPKAINAHLAAAYKLRSGDIDAPKELLSLDTLLGLDGLGVEWVKEYPYLYFINDELSVEHGNTSSKNPGYAAWKVVSESTHNRLFGHGHKTEIARKTTVTQDGVKEIMAACPGCLCRTDGVVPGHDPVRQHWTQGIGIAEYTEKGLEDYRLVTIRDGRAKVGYWVEAKDELPRIEEDTGHSLTYGHPST